MLSATDWLLIDSTMRGETPLEATESLHLSLKAIYWRRIRIRGKLGARTWAQAVGLAVLDRRAEQDSGAGADVDELVLLRGERRDNGPNPLDV